MDLFVQTEYVNIKKGNLAKPTSEQALVNTPKANIGTVSNSSISKESEEVNIKNPSKPKIYICDGYTPKSKNAPSIEKERFCITITKDTQNKL